MKSRAVMLSACLLAGCVAPDPDSISATPTTFLAYQALSCPALAEDDARVAEEIGYLSYRQSKRRETDIAGMILFGITSTGLGASDWTPQIAQLKGQRDAIGKALRHKDCGIAQAPIDSSQEAILRWSRRARTEDSNA